MTQRIAFLLLYVLMSVGGLQAAPVIFENLPVQKIDITIALPQGSGAIEAQVRARMKTKEGDLFSQTDFDQDLKSLSYEFDRVDPRFNVVDGKLEITLKVWPKPTLRTITFIGNCNRTSKQLMKELGVTLCTVFDRQSFNESFHKLKTYYVKKGFFEAELDYTAAYDDCTNEVDITIAIAEGRSGRIKSIKFCGFTDHEERDILNKMVTKEYNFFTSWLTDEGTFREDAMQHDQAQILNYIQNKGYADAVVDVKVNETDCNNRINIFISAERGELYTLDKIVFNGNCLFTDEQIFSKFAICPGDPYSPEKIRDTISNITDLYGRFGYIDAYVNFEPNLECERSYSVNFEIEEGEQFKIGLIKVFGNCTTQSNVILHETLLIPGEVFNVEKLRQTEKRLENIGYFKKVNVYAVKTEGCSLPGNYRDVHIEVDETSTGKFGLFFGFSTTENLFAGVNLSENNFNIAAVPYVWNRGLKSLRGGGEYVNLSAQIGNKSTSYELSWTKPYFMDTEWSVGFDITKSYNNYISNRVDMEALGLTLRAGRQINSFVRLQTHWRITDNDVNVDEEHYYKQIQEGLEASDKALINPTNYLTGKTPEEIRELVKNIYKTRERTLYEQNKNDGIVSAVGCSLIYDATDSPTAPSRGLRSALEWELAGCGGEYKFWSFAYLNTYYYPMGDNFTFKYRADFRFIAPFGGTGYDTMPLDEKLFLGNNSLVRGYRPYRIGPLFPGTDIPSGGLSQQYFSIELNKKWNNKIDGFLFLDVGHLSEHDWNFDWNKYRGSVGLGMRVVVLDSLPPISLGMGFPLNPRNRSEVKKFFMQFGCKF